MTVVADTGPINYLVQLGRVELLHSSYGRVFLPHAAVQELLHPNTPISVREWAQKLPAWCEIRRVHVSDEMPVETLDAGEREAISLAHELHTIILIDDLKGRRVAQQLGLKVAGTLALLVAAARTGELLIEETLKELVELGFHLDHRTREQVIELARSV